MRRLMIAAALLFAATPALAQQAQTPPPTPADVQTHVTAEQNGQTIESPPDGAIAVELQSSPSTGSSWRVASKPEFLGDPHQLSGPTYTPAAGERPRLGSPRWPVFVFPVSGGGPGDLVLEKVGPGSAGVVDTFRVTVTAQ